MKYFLVTLLLAFAAVNAHAQITSDQIKTELAGREWKIINYEVFGVVDAPKPEQANDKIVLNPDMSFVVVENGKEYKGKWAIMNPIVYISCKSSSGTWSKVYKVISIGEKESVIEYKDPDLIKTKYYLQLK